MSPVEPPGPGQPPDERSSPERDPRPAPGEPVPVGPFDHTDDDGRRNLALVLVVIGAFVAIMGVAGIVALASH